MSFWRFGFTTTSSIDTLLGKQDLTIEELLDEDDLLQECKAQNPKLVEFLGQTRTIKRLFQHVVGTAEVSGPGGKEWEEKVRFKYPYIASEVLCSEIHKLPDVALANSEELLEPFWNTVLHARPNPLQPPQPHHSHPLLAGSPSSTPKPPGKTLAPESEDSSSSSAAADSQSTSSPDGEASASHIVKATDSGPGKSVLAGYWAKVNGVFLDKRPREMLAFIRGLPRIVERFVAHLETPAVVDLLYRIVSCEQTMPAAGVVTWLSNNDLIPQVVELLSPTHSVDLHNTVAELLKAIIALSAPAPTGMGQGPDSSFGEQQQTLGVQNKLVRELASEAVVRRMVSFMLDPVRSAQLSRRLSAAAEQQGSDDEDDDGGLSFGTRKSVSSRQSGFRLPTLDEGSTLDENALDDEEADDTDPQPLNPSITPAFDTRPASHRDSTATVRPKNFFPPVKAPKCPVTPETTVSSLITGIGIFIELIRKNNSDYFEQHLFHSIRTHLLQRQQEIASRKAQDRSQEHTEGSNDAKDDEEEDDEMEGMEEAMAEMTDRLGIVHLGPMLTVLCERLSEFQELINQPRSSKGSIVTTLGEVKALSFERYRITELYAELLHCSNMALLNRAPGEGPQYSVDGALEGGIQGLQTLSRTLQGGDGGDTTEAAAPSATNMSRSGSSIHSWDDPVPTSGQASGSRGSPNRATGAQSATEEKSIPASTAAGRADDDADPFGDDSSASNDKEAGDTAAQDDEDAQSIRSAISSMSLADLVSPKVSTSPSPDTGDGKKHVVGDLLKKRFLDCDIVPTILSLFFDYPWNNFLHNVVYDILQQCFNGRMDAGLNRKLTAAVFKQGRLPQKILLGQKQNNESVAGPRRIRLGFMGHMNLIAEETVKLLERYPQEVGDVVKDHIPQPDWDNFVNEVLKENRERESAPLAGGRPMMNQMNQFGSFGGGGDSGFDSGSSSNSLGQGGNTETFANYLSSQMGGSTSDDDDSDEDAGWLTHDNRGNAGFDDVFDPSTGAPLTATSTADDEDDEWGPFSSQDGPSTAAGPATGGEFGSFQSSASGPLTSADWAASSFQRSGSFDDGHTGGSDRGSSSDDGGHEFGRAHSDEGWPSPNEDSTPFVDLSDAASYRQAQLRAQNRTAEAQVTTTAPTSPGAAAAAVGAPITRRRKSSSAGSTDPSAAQAVDKDQPMGPGVPSDVEVENGMMKRRLSDGSVVSAPLDDVALAQHAIEETVIEEDDEEVAESKGESQ